MQRGRERQPHATRKRRTCPQNEPSAPSLPPPRLTTIHPPPPASSPPTPPRLLSIRPHPHPTTAHTPPPFLPAATTPASHASARPRGVRGDTSPRIHKRRRDSAGVGGGRGGGSDDLSSPPSRFLLPRDLPPPPPSWRRCPFPHGLPPPPGSACKARAGRVGVVAESGRARGMAYPHPKQPPPFPRLPSRHHLSPFPCLPPPPGSERSERGRAGAGGGRRPQHHRLPCHPPRSTATHPANPAPLLSIRPHSHPTTAHTPPLTPAPRPLPFGTRASCNASRHPAPRPLAFTPAPRPSPTHQPPQPAPSHRCKQPINKTKPPILNHSPANHPNPTPTPASISAHAQRGAGGAGGGIPPPQNSPHPHPGESARQKHPNHCPTSHRHDRRAPAPNATQGSTIREAQTPPKEPSLSYALRLPPLGNPA